MAFFKRQKSSSQTLGKQAEQWACRHLKNAGLHIIETNYRTSRGEIDIIAKQDDSYVFVEVRLRSNHMFGNANDSIVGHKQQKIILAATHYLQRKKLWDKVPCRFDTICIDLHTCAGNYQLEWTPNAFNMF